MIKTLKSAAPEALRDLEEEKRVRGTDEVFILFALGSQFDHLIKQALERIGVFCLVADPATVTAQDIAAVSPIGIILSGGPASVHAEPPPFDRTILDLGIPVLGICLGFQLWAAHVGARVTSAERREFGTHDLALANRSNALFAGIPNPTPVLESHGDRIEPDNRLETLGSTIHAPVAAARYRYLWGVQFHPEVTETVYGRAIFENFCFGICGAKDRFPAADAAAKKIRRLRETVGDKKVLLLISGGSDSSVVAYLLKNALDGKPGQIIGVYIRGIDRPEDEDNVRRYFGNEPWMELKVADATDVFLAALRGITSMREKRLAMRGVYKQIAQAEAQTFGANFIAQGTLYTDISESGAGYDSGARRAEIKRHHNVNLGFDREELLPLADCVKDGARNIGRAIGVPEELLTRHPFPGPGLVVRIEGEVTSSKLAIARSADIIFIEELRRFGCYESVWQAGAFVTASKTTCTKGDDACEGIVIELWAVCSVNGFTARWARLPEELLDHVSRRITNEIHEAGAVVYRISDKPPSTIECG